MDMAQRAFGARVELWSGDVMTQVLASTGLFRDRDLFIHDGKKLRRFRISAPVQAVFFVILLGLVAWASFATARLITPPHSSLSAATEARARLIERRQALIEAALTGQKIDPAMIQAAATSGRLAKDGLLARVEQQQLEQAALVAQALDTRYQVTAAELQRLGIKPAAAGELFCRDCCKASRRDWLYAVCVCSCSCIRAADGSRPIVPLSQTRWRRLFQH